MVMRKKIRATAFYQSPKTEAQLKYVDLSWSSVCQPCEIFAAYQLKARHQTACDLCEQPTDSARSLSKAML